MYMDRCMAQEEGAYKPVHLSEVFSAPAYADDEVTLQVSGRMLRLSNLCSRGTGFEFRTGGRLSR